MEEKGIPFSYIVKSVDGETYLDSLATVTDLIYAKATDIYVENMINGYSSLKAIVEDIQEKGLIANKENGQSEALKVAIEDTIEKNSNKEKDFLSIEELQKKEQEPLKL